MKRGVSEIRPPIPDLRSLTGNNPMHLSRYMCPVVIGRDSELAALTELWRTVHTGRGRPVLVTGEAGVGKTRLLAALTEQVKQEGATVLLGHSFPTDLDLPYAPLLDALRTRFHGLSPQQI